MTMARAHLVDPSVTRWYHCVTRCVRRAFLLGEGPDDRKEWIENRLQELAEIFAVAVGGFSVMDNHLHVLVRLDPDVAKAGRTRKSCGAGDGCFHRATSPGSRCRFPTSWVQWRLKDEPWVAMARTRLQSLSWFMKCLKEPLSRLANRQDKTRGAFFEGRFKSVAILDDESLLATCAYIDLNPVAAGIAEVPEASPHTSIKTRVEHVKAQGRAGDLKAAEQGSVAGSNASAAWRNRSGFARSRIDDELDSSREGMLEGFSLGSYLLLVDYTGRLFRDGKAAISAELSGILDRLGSSAESWRARLEKLSSGRLLGRFFAASRERLREVAARLGVHHLANLGGCPAR